LKAISYKPNAFVNYIEVLKPRETSLLVLIGLCAALIASGGYLQIEKLVLAVIAIGLGSAGSNGLTNFLDRNIDARMSRTNERVLPSKRIYPAQKVLPLIITLFVVSLILAWFLNPLCFVFGLIGIIASAIWRKTISCTFLGIIAGCSPVLVGWFAINPIYDLKIVLICILVALWIPIHVWSVMVAHRDDYLNAGLSYFPLNLQVKHIVIVLFILSILLFIVSNMLYFFTDLGRLYFIIVIIMGLAMVYANARLLFSATSVSAWRVYKFSSFPYLGIVFIVMCIDILLT
jgi:protoheme IX farnesyltransferase